MSIGKSQRLAQIQQKFQIPLVAAIITLTAYRLAAQ